MLALSRLLLLCHFVFVPLFCVLRSFPLVVFSTVRSAFCGMLLVIFINDSVVCLASRCWCVVYVFLVSLSYGLPWNIIVSMAVYRRVFIAINGCLIHRLTLNWLHGVIFQKIVLFITTTARTSDPTSLLVVCICPVGNTWTVWERGCIWVGEDKNWLLHLEC
jgi:hypothetical protein